MKSKLLNLLIGVFVSIIFLYFALSKIDINILLSTLSRANYFFLVPSLFLIFVIFWLKTIRWKYLLLPVKNAPVWDLMKSMTIGYAANNILPAHLGELLRVFITAKKSSISRASVLATIVVEKIIDMFSLTVLLSLTLLIYPFPAWVKKSGIIMLIFTIIIFLFVILMKFYQDAIIKVIEFILKPLPEKLHKRISDFIISFAGGLNLLKNKRDYLLVLSTTSLVWVCFILLFYVNFYTFGMISTYKLSLFSSLVIVVITTISIVIPSSPGYIGTFHWLCQFSLGLFSIPRETGLSYAIVLHALNYLPVLLFGLILAWREGVQIAQVSNIEFTNNSEQV